MTLMKSATSIGFFNKARVMLAKAIDVDEVRDIRDRAEALRAYAKQSGESLEAQNQCAQIKLRAERRAGELLGEISPGSGRPKKSHDATFLDSTGITKTQSSRWQAIASLPEGDFEGYISAAVSNAKELTTSGALKMAKRIKASAESAISEDVAAGDSRIVTDLADLAGADFGTVYADPAWKYGNQATRASTDNHYETMTVDEICALPVENIVAENAHLHLWTTNAFLFDAKQVMEAWGFTYKSVMVWVKPQMGIGNYWRVSHEFLLLGVRGKTKFGSRSMKSWVEENRGRHSQKPAIFRQMVEKVSPGPHIELFSRQAHEGWSAWGNQVAPIDRGVFDVSI